ncbi:MAG: gliding motility lipoprotein GldH [Dysgonamonadaceae bacterium]|jgi:gliding motility-associated lipoprotein GldH|nr:gliding motility lipoprotein GldH [Dysgonamonadaceae bacterium]
MVRQNSHKLLSLFLLLALTFACKEKNGLYFQYKGIENGKWNQNTSFNFAIEITDTLSYYDIFLEIRNNDSYPFRNLWLFVNLKTPEGSTRKDTANCELADIFGKWHGKGGSLYALSLPFEQNVRFHIPGTYLYSIRQGMRTEELEGISDIGLRVVKQGNQ